MTAQQAYDEILAYINRFTEAYSEWYAGIASNAKTRLFTEHGVSEPSGHWIFRTLPSDTDARIVEQALLKLGCDGGKGGGDSSTTQVYAYLKTSQTNQ
jgi:hypothetical protein